MSRFLIPLSDYNRIHQVIHGVANAFGGAAKGCIFFAACGAYLLEKHYKIAARPVAGGFALRVNDKPEVAFFGEDKGDHIVASADGFHMWIQTETHLIDFMAPIFPEAFAARNLSVPRRMFQRMISSEVGCLDELEKPGDFFTFSNPKLTQELMTTFMNRASSGDLVEVADAWFGDRRKPQNPSIQMGDSEGEVYDLVLPLTKASGSW